MSNALPDKFMAWHNRPTLDHTGTWATTRYPDDAEEYVKVAALPGLVMPLEFWVSDTGDLCCDSMIGRYQIQKGGARWCCMYAMGRKRRPKGDDTPTYHRTEEAAKAAAQHHHVAQIMAAFGIDAAAMKEGKDA